MTLPQLAREVDIHAGCKFITQALRLVQQLVVGAIKSNEQVWGLVSALETETSENADPRRRATT
jgi:hypothetical protein